MKSNLNLGDLYRIKSALVDSLPNQKNEELWLTKNTIEKVTVMMNELMDYITSEYGTDKEMQTNFAKESN